MPRRGALARAGLSPHEVDIVSSHATATPLGDQQECEAMRAVFGDSPQAFCEQVLQRAAALAAGGQISALLRAKRRQRESDEALKPLATYRAEELARMRRNFYGFDPSYHIARSNFVQRVAPSWTPRHLAIHRRT